MKRLQFLLFIWLILLGSSNCYFNPFVQKYIFPDPTKENSLFSNLTLLGLTQAPFALSLTGQIRDQNGTAVPDAVLTVMNRSSELEGLDSTVTTNATGRFFIRLSSGTTTFSVTQDNSPYFIFTVLITSIGDISVLEIKNNSVEVEVSSFFVYDPGNQPSFFELIESDPFHRSTRQVGPSALYLYFSEPPVPPNQGEELAWLTQNVSISPSFTFGNLSFEVDSMIVLVSGYSSQTTTYTVSLGPGIFGSNSGLPLTPRTIVFTCEYPCGL
ncbi:carboxypeptidase-like regulatory domain-containing protein [Leptospira limi]|uniref:Carboxypeptidase-like regulatory domain-containing protein n=1 Tax=Leptospira limi TaxID=2950023 RepID=A0ABT3LSC7_9LEPT|nr:carboxypeptidase-like regulatory domain-containing protein [Leptospira limi]MCW7460599.1 carboxypeptidase-like regulatory domain-containing protein [Leptospira limi]